MCRLICFLTIPITTHRTPANLRVPIPHQKLGFSTLCPLFCLICTIISQKTGHFDQYQNTPGPGSQVPPGRQVRHPLGSKKISVRYGAQSGSLTSALLLRESIVIDLSSDVGPGRWSAQQDYRHVGESNGKRCETVSCDRPDRITPRLVESRE